MKVIKYILELIKRNKNLKKVLKKIIFKLSKPVPKYKSKKDVYLVSFPKSGNTWVRFILSKILIKSSKKDYDFDIEDLNKIIPDIHMMRNFKKKSNFPPFPRIIKSHACFTKEYPKIIYILRDPKDVMVSSFYYYKTRGKIITNNFSKFIRLKKYGLEKWAKHYSSWKNHINCLITYENLKKDTKKEIKKVLKYFEVPVKESHLISAIKESSFSNLKRKEFEEMKKGKRDFLKGNNQRFFRSGKIGQWKKYFKKEDLEYYKKIMKKYEIKIEEYNP